MALIVEDGTGLANAESYVSTAYADTYHAAMGATSWAAEGAPSKETALRKATQYMDAHYRFIGQRYYESVQALEWPRDQYAWDDPIMKRLFQACCELALKSLTEDLFVDVDDRAVTEETVGPISVAYGAPTSGGQVRYALVDEMLRPLVSGGRSSMRIDRA